MYRELNYNFNTRDAEEGYKKDKVTLDYIEGMWPAWDK